MQKEEFLANFSNQFDDTDASEIAFNTIFKDLDEWSSLTALSIIAMCDEEYGVKVTGDDIKNSTTVEDLFNLVVSRK
jgi:acyl carrier protein